MHRDICGSNILVAENTVSGEPDGVTIIDFGLATTTRQETLTQPVVADAGADSLAYIAPEQTGRMNRSVDHRSDLYSLGVTLYELFTGQLPFQTDEALELIHSPHSRQNGQSPLTAASMSLLPEPLVGDHTQTDREERRRPLPVNAVGLGADLVTMPGSTAAHRKLLNPLNWDRVISVTACRFAQKLYGRQSEIAQLVATYDRVAQGNTELQFIAGYSGVGKTSLVHEIKRDVVAKEGVFVEGKFDQLQQTPTLLCLGAGLHAVGRTIGWRRVKPISPAWRAAILDAVGDYGQILIDIIPALERIIGPQPDVPQLGGLENQNRLNYTFNRFISRLATPEHPLVVFPR